MPKKTRGKTALRYGVTGLKGAGIALAAACARGFAPGQDAAWNARYLSDGCFVAAVLLVGLGALTWISTTGFFDMFAYGVKSLLVLFTPLRHPKDQQTFYDYKMAKDAKRGKPLFFILLVGLAYLAASLLLLAAYYAG